MDDRESRHDPIGTIRKAVEVAQPDLRAYYRMTRKGKIVAVYASDGAYYADVQPLRNDGQEDNGEPVISHVSLPVVWGGNNRGIVCPPSVGTPCDITYYDGDPNFPAITNMRWGGGNNAPRAGLNEFVIQLENGVELRIDQDKHIIMLTPEDVRTEAGKTWTIKAGTKAVIEADEEITLRAPRINLQGVLVSTNWDGGRGQASFSGSLAVDGDAYAATQAQVAANGTLVLTDGVDTGVQDIRLRLFTRLGNLFYDTDFGSLLHDWIREESTASARAAFCAEVITRVEADPRVVPGTVTCNVTSWDAVSLTALCRWRFLDSDTPLSLVLQANKSTLELVIADVKPCDTAPSVQVS